MGTATRTPEVDSVVELPEGTLETCDYDGPGVAAGVLITLPSGGQLTLCQHHANELGFKTTGLQLSDGLVAQVNVDDGETV